MEVSSRYLIGIDLGTTNSAVAYIDRQAAPQKNGTPTIRVFEVPQFVAEGELGTLSGLPSFLYFTGETESTTDSFRLPWEEGPQSIIVGRLAREQGALVPGRQVSSAKSWLSLSSVDRTADILPWGAEQPEHSCSPVAASARYLAHLRDAWNYVMASNGEGGDEAGGVDELRFEQQEIVLTVPASFDEEARELTVQAARDAGLIHLTLLEEPLAAFYAWIAAHRTTLKRHLKDGQLILICDVGGGTTDFSLIRVSVDGKDVRFARTAIGEHLLLGGDNVDLALARRVEEKLGHPRLSLRQQNALRRQCCAAKEKLLGDATAERVPLTVLGGGRSVIGGALATELTRIEVEQILTEGFLPLTAPDDLPARDKRTGLRELGLPYASEAAITKHLGAFLRQAATAMSVEQPRTLEANQSGAMVRPDAVLFNGGFFLAPLTVERVVAAIAGWFPPQGKKWRPKVLTNESPDSAVAVGAASYAHVRHGNGLRISGGSARGYFIGVQHVDTPHPAHGGVDGREDASKRRVTAVCVLPRGTEEGTKLELAEREFTVLTNRPVSFTLYSTTTRHDSQGAVITFDEEDIHRHAPLITVLRYGKRSRQTELDVRLTAHFTEVGTLELWCESPKTGHRWRLQFQLRGVDREAEDEDQSDAATGAQQQSQIHVSDDAVEAAGKMIRAVFGGPRDSSEGETPVPESLTSQMEGAIGYRKDAWRMEMIRKLCDVLAEHAAGRKKGRGYEARWLNLFGFCLRPGFGAVLDDWRIAQARKVYLEGLSFPKDAQCQVEWLILWRRVAGGLNAGQQRELYERHKTQFGIGGKKAKVRLNRQIEQEGWLLLASLEHLPASMRVMIGEELISRIEEEPDNKGYIWALGRLGARVPFYGPLNCMVPAEAAARWARLLLGSSEITPHVASAIIQLTALTNDRLRDVEPETRYAAIEKLTAAGADAGLIESLRIYVPPTRADAVRIFGESLPEGLRLLA
ncbi:MAG: Hsp70 family protein [Pyrinomonadaceae bacterium]|nr:Hsp70 family protein [Pyrinomonadaceae bacterium]